MALWQAGDQVDDGEMCSDEVAIQADYVGMCYDHVGKCSDHLSWIHHVKLNH